jgi:hypothetical protein
MSNAIVVVMQSSFMVYIYFFFTILGISQITLPMFFRHKMVPSPVKEAASELVIGLANQHKN